MLRAIITITAKNGSNFEKQQIIKEINNPENKVIHRILKNNNTEEKENIEIITQQDIKNKEKEINTIIQKISQKTGKTFTQTETLKTITILALGKNLNTPAEEITLFTNLPKIQETIDPYRTKNIKEKYIHIDTLMLIENLNSLERKQINSNKISKKLAYKIKTQINEKIENIKNKRNTITEYTKILAKELNIPLQYNKIEKYKKEKITKEIAIIGKSKPKRTGISEEIKAHITNETRIHTYNAPKIALKNTKEYKRTTLTKDTNTLAQAQNIKEFYEKTKHCSKIIACPEDYRNEQSETWKYIKMIEKQNKTNQDNKTEIIIIEPEIKQTQEYKYNQIEIQDLYPVSKQTSTGAQLFIHNKTHTKFWLRPREVMEYENKELSEETQKNIENAIIEEREKQEKNGIQYPAEKERAYIYMCELNEIETQKDKEDKTIDNAWGINTTIEGYDDLEQTLKNITITIPLNQIKIITSGETQGVYTTQWWYNNKFQDILFKKDLIINEKHIGKYEYEGLQKEKQKIAIQKHMGDTIICNREIVNKKKQAIIIKNKKNKTENQKIKM